MSDRVEIVRRSFEAFNRGDIDAALEHAAEDLEVMPPPEAPEAIVYRGAAGYRQAVSDWLEPWEFLSVDLLDASEHGEKVLLSCRGVGVGKGSRAEISYPYWQLTTFRGNKFARLQIFQSREDAESAMADG